MEFLELAKSRYSTRKYKDRKVEDEKIRAILEAARVAPSAHNKQAFKIIVAEQQEDMEMELYSIQKDTIN